MLPVLFAMPVLRSHFDLGQALKHAQKHAGLKNDALASLLGITEPRLCAWVNGEEHVSVKRILKAAEDEDGKKFAVAFWLAIGRELGIEEPSLVEELRAIQGLMLKFVNAVQRKAMAKAELRERKQERSA